MEVKTRWTKKDIAVDFIWNTFSISPRVIALALFASYQPYWFAGLIIVQILVSMILSCRLIYKRGCVNDGKLRLFLMSLLMSIGMVFNMFHGLFSVDFILFMFYWCLMFIENVVMISLWYQWSTGFGLFFHELALIFVIVAYVVSLIIKCAHCFFYEPNLGEKNILKWKLFAKCESEDSLELTTGDEQFNNAESRA